MENRVMSEKSRMVSKCLIIILVCQSLMKDKINKYIQNVHATL